MPGAIRRLALEQIDRATWQLTDPPAGRDKGVHEARKCFKKVRAVLRLVRDEVGERVYRRENVCFRDAGRLLAPVRETAVLIETYDKIEQRFAPQLAPNSFNEVRNELVELYQATCHRVLDQEDSVDQVLETLQLARQRVADWPIESDGFGAFYGGLRRVYRRGRNRLRDAFAVPSEERFHEWRKRVKYLWYHTRILKVTWPVRFTAHANELSQLADWLGDKHDLAEFRDLVQNRPEMFADKSELQVLLALIDYWRHELEALARPVGQRIYVERPRAFVDRLAAYWQIWQQESTA